MDPRRHLIAVTTGLLLSGCAVLRDPAVQASLATSYSTAVGGTPQQFGEKIRSDVQRYADVIQKANIRID